MVLWMNQKEDWINMKNKKKMILMLGLLWCMVIVAIVIDQQFLQNQEKIKQQQVNLTTDQAMQGISNFIKTSINNTKNPNTP